jgi:uncharacterized protein YqeY
MSDDNFQDEVPAYSFQGSSPADELHEIARVHYLEAAQLFEHAQESLAEDRQEEAKLLIDLAKSRRERADEFERAARGEGGDPIVTEILADQQETLDNYTPHTTTFMSEEELAAAAAALEEERKPPPLTGMARVLDRILRWIP